MLQVNELECRTRQWILKRGWIALWKMEKNDLIFIIHFKTLNVFCAETKYLSSQQPVAQLPSPNELNAFSQWCKMYSKNCSQEKVSFMTKKLLEVKYKYWPKRYLSKSKKVVVLKVLKYNQYLNCRRDAEGRVPPLRVSVPPSRFSVPPLRFKRWMIRRKRPNSSH